MKYPPNLCDLTHEERQAIELDKVRWFTAYKWITTLTRPAINSKLAELSGDELDDMRSRLNKIKNKYKKTLKKSFTSYLTTPIIGTVKQIN